MTRRSLAAAGAVLAAAFSCATAASHAAGDEGGWDPARGLLIAGATVVTMDDEHTVVPHGRVLVRDGRIVAVWSGPEVPEGVDVAGASLVEASPQDLLFPGLINLHSHPSFNHLHTWPAPSSHAIPSQDKLGTDPYANRYQWGGAAPANAPPEHRRLVTNAASVLGDPAGLGLSGEIVKYAEVAALLGGETALQGAPRDPESDGVLARNVDNDAFDTRIAPPRVQPIGAFAGVGLANLLGRMRAGEVDAWMVHLAEGVRDASRRAGDAFSSRAELATLAAKGLLTDMTVVIHGTALERQDFAALRAAPTIRDDGLGDGRGAKLVWSPLSNLLLYGETTSVFDALAEGVLVSLGTDWSPSGSRTLLQELKVADVALRDVRLLGNGREQLPAFAVDGKVGLERRDAEEALDQALVDMVTRNPALTLRWYDRVGSVEAGKVADLVLVRRRAVSPVPRVPVSVYRELIEATERDVRLVLVGGDPLAGDVDMLAPLKPGDFETVRSLLFEKAVDVTTEAPVSEGGESLARITTELEAGVTALGGDHPPAGGGPGPPGNTYSYLREHVAGGAYVDVPDDQFAFGLGLTVGFLFDGSVNIERVQLAPLFAADDDFLWYLLRGEIDGTTGLLADPTPPFALYPANLNHVGPLGNPFLAPG